MKVISMYARDNGFYVTFENGSSASIERKYYESDKPYFRISHDFEEVGSYVKRIDKTNALKEFIKLLQIDLDAKEGVDNV